MLRPTLILVAGLALVTPHCFGQSTKSAPTAPNAATLSEPFRMDSVGLSIRFPEGCQVSSNRIGGRATAQIRPADGTWNMNIQTPVSSKDDGTVKEALDKTISLIQGSFGVVDQDQKNVLDTQAQILDRTDDLKLPGGNAARVYVSIPRGDKSRLVKGYTIFRPQSKQYVVFEFVCHEPDFDKLRSTYETIVGTALFENAQDVMLARGATVKAGASVLAEISEQDYDAVLNDKEVWYRWYAPSETGASMDAQELGYRGVRTWRGKRGEISPSKAKSAWTKADLQEGYLAQVRARVLMDKGAVDTVALYFMTPDRQEECWTITTSVKDDRGNEVGMASETGARIKDDMTIVATASGKPALTVKPPIMGEGYISQFETVVMPRLLVRKRLATDLGFYCYQRNPGDAGGTIAFRRDTLKQQGKIWTVQTSFREEAKPQSSTYTETGELLNTTLGDGSVWEPMELTSLKRLWQNKGLPTDR
ncbi:MAG: hypothetical protein K2W85_08825 [Phycisphaerales bacterium]|nr:hypothetical protein [Phycisphaerales bacterium]